MVSDPRCGEDPYRTSHFENFEAFAQQNPHSDEQAGSASFDTEAQAKEYAESVQATLEQGYPEPYWPGAPQYINALDIEVSKFVSGQTTVDEALQNVEDKWNSIVEDLGKEEQQNHYQRVIDAWKNAGIWET
jgi:maltose-binding protein MalE